ncbi:MAG: TaqI-like C-terminal specificity domain-containing protein [Flavobacteriales bacterium]|jgi:tRNA1(Val) A37 N6-methylase TrmN6|nr:TaqI-like C-terminal specificity domain-containing protein [Flavobacteriales bacterium]
MSDKKDHKLRIHEAIEAFATGDPADSALHLLKILGYAAPRLNYFAKGSFAEFEETFGSNNPRFNKQNALHQQWKKVDLLFQLTGDNLGAQQGMFQNERVDNTIIESYLFFALELRPKKEGAYTRTELSQITREVNKCFAMPAMILFKTGDTLSFAVIDRRLHKRESSKDVLEKVTLIKDIRTTGPHRAHIEILFDLGLEQLRKKHDVPNFPKLHEAWRKTLDTKELNKRFFRELSNWYFHAVEVTQWPADAEPDKDKRNAINTIRLITRLMFVWFLKEKDLVPEDLFDTRKLDRMLRTDSGEESLYYKAILQNLFFATLNTEMGEKRRFRIEADRSQSKHYFIHNVFRYERCFKDPKAALKDVFAPIPFLNGGLFECLDKQVEVKGKLVPVRVDGFSDRKDNPLLVPDKLFFDPEGEEYDFSEVYGSKKARKEKVRGLIDILSSYKFTITENTPIEEEVALDPELLGKVFENLLANYNPETKTTARKQTGSFYTPREIVNYMVDESLIAYLRTSLDTPAPSTHTERSRSGVDLPSAEDRLRHLLSYSEEPHQFTPKETERLIAAIDTCKILDPACGSGAFPMGVLHKLVHVLHKLDPQNKQWKERQVEKAALLDDADIRERTIADIEDAFEHNALDYGRKLYLIENGIYGVDIQPIAMQIAKLRFFISLVVDQRVDAKRPNLGVRPLPNLETKFVAANTLMKLEREEANLFTNPAIDKKKAQLKRVRHDYFEARTPQRKAKCREQDKQLREELAELLVGEHELQPKTAKMLAAWDPYDQNASAPFFDPEWMYGLSRGFDVVIGNPPYVLLQDAVRDDTVIANFRRQYTVASYKLDLYHLFYEAGLSVLNAQGVLAYITPSNFQSNNYAIALRRYLLTNSHLEQVISVDSKVFDAEVNNAVVICRKSSKPGSVGFYRSTWTDTYEIEYVYSKPAADILATDDALLVAMSKAEDEAVLNRIASTGLVLEDVADIRFGMQLRSKADYPQDIIIHRAGAKPKRPYVKCYRGSDVNPWSVQWSGHYCYFVDDARRGGCWDRDFHNRTNKILIRQVGLTPVVGLDQSGYAVLNTAFMVCPTNEKNALVLLALLNSSTLQYFYLNRFGDKRADFPKIKGTYLAQLPVKDPPAKVKAQLEKLVEKRLGMEAGPAAEAVEREIDQVVYGLYGLTAEEIAIVEGSVKRKGGSDDQKVSGSDDGEVMEKKKRGRPRKA